MSNTDIASPRVETTKKFILIKIPRDMFSGQFSHKKLSTLERGLRESITQAKAGELRGPFRSAKALLRELKKPV